MDLNGARILVVGATGVLGRRLCERLSERTTDIVVTGRSASSAEELRRGLGLRAAHALFEGAAGFDLFAKVSDQTQYARYENEVIGGQLRHARAGAA